MYLVPLALIVAIALAIFVSPIIALVIFVLFVLGLAAFKLFGPGTDPERATRGEGLDSPNEPGAPTRSRDDGEGGAWGEQWPEERPRE